MTHSPMRPRGLTGLASAILLTLTVATPAVLAQGGADNLTVRRSRLTDRATFITAADGGELAVPPQFGAAAGGNAFVDTYGPLFGISDAAKQLAAPRIGIDLHGLTTTTYQQVHKGVPVFAGEFKAHQNAAGKYTAANGHIWPVSDKLDTEPTLNQADAVAAALATQNGALPAVETLELVIVDPGWYGDRPIGARLAWYVILNGTPDPLREAFFIDAHSGAILDQWSMLENARDRRIYNGNGGSAIPGTLARVEGQAPTGQWEVDQGYDYVGDVYDFFWRAFGRDSFDDEGSAMIATVNSGYDCPNAFWNGQQIIFCTGFAADDVVGHEFGHGVTQYTANLIYQNQSGQLNESYSDIWGELIDLFNGNAGWPGTPGGSPTWPTHPTGPGTDTPNNYRTACSSPPDHANGVRWMLGEDVYSPPYYDGALRDMWFPTCEGDPDRAYSSLQTCNPLDNGGVHSGSGVQNHAFAIVVDGTTFNGQTVTGIGPIKAGAVWYRALTAYLTPAADFEEAYYALNQAAQDLIGTYPNDPRTGLPSSDVFTASDAQQVDKALIAVEMNGPGNCGATADILDGEPPDQCSPRASIFFDDFENGTNGWSVSHTTMPLAYDWAQISGNLPYGHTGTAWYCDNDPAIGDCGGADDASGIHYLTSPEIVLPSNLYSPTLAFDHYVATEPAYDGGNVRVRVNGGAWTMIPGNKFTYNTYNSTLTTSQNTNPMAGQQAFTGAGGGWGTSLIDISSYVSPGDTVQFRFDFGKDGCNGVTGWFIDNFDLYVCPPTPVGTISGTVLDTYGSPMDGATVSTNTGGYSTVTDNNGWYQIQIVATGTYNVTASKPGYTAGTTNGVAVADGETTVVDFALEPLPNDATITGQVRNQSSQPIAGAVVNTDAGCHWAVTDSDGDYTLTGVAAGTYAVTAFKVGYDATTVSGVVVGSGATVTQNITLPPASPFAGVLNANFEGGSYADPDSDHLVANHWHKFVTGGNPKHHLTWLGGGAHSANYVQDFYEANYAAGIYQVVNGTKPGGTYTGSAWVKGSNGDPKFWVGLDPDGGTNAAAPGVQWSISVNPGATWQKISKQVVVNGTSVTLFIKAQYPYAGSQNSFIDDASITENSVPTTGISRSPSTLSPTVQQGQNASDMSFTVANSGDGILTYDVCDDAHWMWLDPPSGTSSGPTDEQTVDVHFATTTLTTGTYTGTIRITDPFAANNPQEIAVTLTVDPPPTVPPDLDGDTDVDVSDFAAFQTCFNGPGQPPAQPDCEHADFDGDNDVDVGDFAEFSRCFNGAAQAPACQ